MKNKYKLLIIILILFLLSVSALNLKVNYYQGINYKVKQLKVPLYLKLLDFFSRHFHYQQLVAEIVGPSKGQEEKIFKLFDWTYRNIRNVPEGFPVIDDHIWNIIVRGYGADDQFHDVFATLGNYAGIEVFFIWVASSRGMRKIPLSFVKLKGKWFIFDPFHGTYFKNKTGGLADIETIKSADYLVEGLSDSISVDYSSYIGNLPSIKNIGLRRANTQSPLNRLLFELKIWKNKFLIKR